MDRTAESIYYDYPLTPPSPLVPAIARDLEQDSRSPWRQPLIGDFREGPYSGVGEIVSDLADVAQCIRVILTTPKGSDPYRPDFSMDILDYLDWPIQKATPLVVREAMRAVLTWEPRVEVLKVGIRYDEAPQGHAYISIEWRLKDPPRSTQKQLTEVLYGQAFALS